MRIHHLNCGTFCPAGGALMDGVSKGPRGRLVCHCWLLELGDQLVLVDTGLGLGDVHDPVPRLSPLYMGLLGVQLREEETAVRQVERLGFSAADVRHIVLTHMDFDHAGGLEDFPNATVHLMAKEAAAAQAREGFVGRRRYRPQQWDEVGKWETYEPRGERWFGFGAVRELKGLPPEILMVPLRGHTLGHAGVAVQGPSGWLLHAGDAYFYREEVRPGRPPMHPGPARLSEAHGGRSPGPADEPAATARAVGQGAGRGHRHVRPRPRRVRSRLRRSGKPAVAPVLALFLAVHDALDPRA